MNSALQCLSNTEPLTRYLLKKSSCKDVNPVLTKSRGTLFFEFQALISEMWTEKNSYVNPREVKMSLSWVNGNFAGYDQQDAQEFLSYFIDSLMDETNKVSIKPYEE